MRKMICSTAAIVALLPGALAALGGPPAVAAEKTRVAIVDVDTPATKWHYEPNEVTVAAGSTVVWRNEGNQPHTVTSDKTADNKSFNSSYLTNGQEWEWTFSTPGDYSYYCEPHNWMRGVLHVTGASRPGPTTAPSATQPTPGTTPTTSTASTPKPTAASATTTTRAAAPSAAATTTTKAPPAASTPPGAPVSTTTTPAPAAGAPTAPAAVPATTPPPAVQEEVAAPAVGDAGRGKGNRRRGDHNPVGIALASMATLGVTVIAGRMLLSKPR